MGYLRELTDLSPKEWELLCNRMGNVMVSVARLVLKAVALSLAVAAVVCAVIAYWDQLPRLRNFGTNKVQKETISAEYADYEE